MNDEYGDSVSFILENFSGGEIVLGIQLRMIYVVFRHNRNLSEAVARMV